MVIAVGTARLWVGGRWRRAAGASTGTQTSADRPRSAGRVSRRMRPASSSTVRARSISRRFLLRLNISETSVRVTPAGRSLAAVQISSAVGSPRESPNTQWAELAL